MAGAIAMMDDAHRARAHDPPELADVTGHVLGVIASHDRAIRLLPRRDQLTGQLPLLLVMVVYTGTGLYLLFGA